MGIKFLVEVVKSTKNVVQNVDFKPFPSFTILIFDVFVCILCASYSSCTQAHFYFTLLRITEDLSNIASSLSSAALMASSLDR